VFGVEPEYDCNSQKQVHWNAPQKQNQKGAEDLQDE
jgi:hypothetical protein